MTEGPHFAVVTGAAGGIGEAIVRAFHDGGYQVIATDRATRPSGLPCSLYLQADLERTVVEEGFAAEIFARIFSHLNGSGLNVLINNAAVQIVGGVDSLTRSDWASSLNVNLLAPFIWSQALLPALEAAQSSIINISSIHAKMTKKNFVAYATTKAALSGMSRAMAVDLEGRVRVNAIEPAAIATPMLKAGFAGQPSLYAQLEECHPQRRIGIPQEVAALALAMAKSELRFLHGASIGIDGGISARLHDPN